MIKVSIQKVAVPHHFVAGGSPEPGKGGVHLEREHFIYVTIIDDGRAIWREEFSDERTLDTFLMGVRAGLSVARIDNTIDYTWKY